MSDHPAEFAVGNDVVVTGSLGSTLMWRERGKVIRHTKTLIVVEVPRFNEPIRFAKRFGSYRERGQSGHHYTKLVGVASQD